MTILGILGFAFQLEIYTIYIVVLITCFGWAFCRDLLPSLLAIMIIASTPLGRYAQAGYFSPLYYAPIPIAVAIMVRLYFFRPKKLVKGEFFIPTLAVSIALATGGLFFLTPGQYFSMPAIYYVLGLGFVLLFINSLLETNLEHNVDHTVFFSKMMVGVGVMGLGMIASHYIKLTAYLLNDFYTFTRYFQWGNNLANNLLISMPFAFYLATKRRHSVFYFLVGTAQFLAILMGFSRGGSLFALISFPIAFVSAIVVSGKNRKKLAVTSIVLVVIGVVLASTVLLPLIKDLFANTEKITPDDARLHLYGFGWRNFTNHPVFGTGLAYNPGIYYHPQTMCIYWYHSTLFQILGSLGIVGIIAYGIQAFYRMRALVKVKSRFNLFVFISIIGFAGYSMINVGYFVPLPYGFVLILMFILVSRNNEYLRKNPKVLEKELVGKK